MGQGVRERRGRVKTCLKGRVGPGDGLSVQKRLLASLATLVCVGAACVAAAPTRATPVLPATSPVTAPSLFTPEPPGFDLETVLRLRDSLLSLPARLPEAREALRARSVELGPLRAALILSLFVGVAFVIFGPRIVARRVDARLSPRLAGAPPALRPWLGSALQVLIAIGPPFVLVVSHDVVRRITGFGGVGFLLAGVALGAWLQFAFLVSVWRELVVRPILPVPEAHRTYLFRIGHGLALYLACLTFLTEVVAKVDVPPDLWALVRAIANLCGILLLTMLACRKQAVLALFPALPNRLYQSALRGLAHAYPVIVALTSATALLEWAGFERLAHFVWIRTWALAALFLVAVVTAHALHLLLRRGVLGPENPPAVAATRFARSAERLLDYGIVLLVGSTALDLTGLSGRVRAALDVVLYGATDGPVTLLLLLQAVLVVAVFVFASRLLRDFLDYRIYPTLGVEESIAHACNVFLHYACVIVGSLFALEFVGIGMGALTVFAGALGIGLGFGLQPLATNLSSGLTLVFGRALRRGDWVTVGDTIGQIEEVGMRATSLRTRDDVEYVVPNAQFVSGPIVNWTKSSPLVREHLKLAVARQSNPERVREALLAVAGETSGVERTPPPEVWLSGLGGEGLDFELVVYVNLKRVAWAPVRSALYFGISARLRADGIELPDGSHESAARAPRAEILGALGVHTAGAPARGAPVAPEASGREPTG